MCARPSVDDISHYLGTSTSNNRQVQSDMTRLNLPHLVRVNESSLSPHDRPSNIKVVYRMTSSA